MNHLEWQGVAKASELIGVSQSLLWELKNSNEFVAGEHWLYITGKPKSNVLWNVKAIRQWQIDKTLFFFYFFFPLFCFFFKFTCV